MSDLSNNLDFLSIKKNLKKDFSRFPVTKIAILGDTSTQLFSQAIRGYGYTVGISLEIYEADYDQIEQEIMTPSSGLYNFKPDFVVIFQAVQKLKVKFYDTQLTERSTFADDCISKVSNQLDMLGEISKAKIIFFNFIEINDFVFGNYGNKVSASFIYQLRKLNYDLMSLAIARKNLFINDVSGLNARVGLEQSFDPKLNVNADIVFSLDFTAKVAKSTVDIILPIIGKVKKCLILDLDNTLWGGIIGDDGMENIQLGDLGIGKAFTSLQAWIKELKLRGIILAVCSQNDEANAKEPFEKHPDMILKLDDIAVFVANWGSKAENIKYIQSVLNIGFDSMVFIDDNPFERELVKREVPDVTVPDLPTDPAFYLDYLSGLNLFETASFSEEDLERTRQYQQEAKRVVLKQSFSSEDDYLESLAMTSTVKAFDKFTIPRIAQLTQRSNQFNVRTIRYTEEDIARIANSSDYYTLSFDLNDRFGDHGLIAAIILQKKEESLYIDTWVMSCRVLKRSMENFIINSIAHLARTTNTKKIIGEYIPTPKNNIVKDLYPSLGFTPVDGLWILNLADITQYHKTNIHATS